MCGSFVLRCLTKVIRVAKECCDDTLIQITSNLKINEIIWEVFSACLKQKKKYFSKYKCRHFYDKKSSSQLEETLLKTKKNAIVWNKIYQYNIHLNAYLCPHGEGAYTLIATISFLSPCATADLGFSLWGIFKHGWYTEMVCRQYSRLAL